MWCEGVRVMVYDVTGVVCEGVRVMVVYDVTGVVCEGDGGL